MCVCECMCVCVFVCVSERCEQCIVHNMYIQYLQYMWWCPTCELNKQKSFHSCVYYSHCSWLITFPLSVGADPVLHSTLTGDTQAATIPLMCAGQFVSSPLSPRPHGSSPPGNHGETSPPHGNEDCGTLYCVTSALMEPSVSVLEITVGKMVGFSQYKLV